MELTVKHRSTFVNEFSVQLLIEKKNELFTVIENRHTPHQTAFKTKLLVAVLHFSV